MCILLEYPTSENYPDYDPNPQLPAGDFPGVIKLRFSTALPEVIKRTQLNTELQREKGNGKWGIGNGRWY